MRLLLSGGNALNRPRSTITLLVPLLLATVGLRLWRLDQPLVENYVGRQIPTAMVARNLDQSGPSGFLRPQLDTGPFPNLFLVEPPLFAAGAVALKRLTPLSLEASGRLLSALGIALGAWGLFGLVRRRDGDHAALLAAALFATLPITIRYGRAFQGDALLLGTLLAALDRFDHCARTRNHNQFILAWLLLATALALKIITAWILLPLLLILRQQDAKTRAAWFTQLLLVLSALLPALAWYAHSALILRTSSGSSASLDNAQIWLGALSPASLLDPARLQLYARYLLVRAFTPLFLPLSLLACWTSRNRHLETDRLWLSWTLSASLGLLAVSGKIHHEYYWIVLAPPAAVSLARGLLILANRLPAPSVARLALPLTFATLALAQVSDTFHLPAEWSHLPAASKSIKQDLPSHALIVAPEALLYHSGHKGARLEIHPSSALRAAGEWQARFPVQSADPALDLIELYRAKGLRYLADLPPSSVDAPRRALHRRLAVRYTIVQDGPDLFLIDLQRPAPAEAAEHVAFQP